MAIALTRALIDAASPELSPTAHASWVSLIRQATFYRQSRHLFPDLSSTLAGASEIVIRQLNAVMDQIEALGLRNVSVEGDDEAAHFSIAADREEWIGYVLLLLYDIDIDVIVAGAGGHQRVYSSTLKSRPEW